MCGALQEYIERLLPIDLRPRVRSSGGSPLGSNVGQEDCRAGEIAVERAKILREEQEALAEAKRARNEEGVARELYLENMEHIGREYIKKVDKAGRIRQEGLRALAAKESARMRDQDFELREEQRRMRRARDRVEREREERRRREQREHEARDRAEIRDLDISDDAPRRRYE